MSLRLRPLANHQLPVVYDMMVEQNFPDTPETLEEALDALQATKAYGLFLDETLQAAFLFMDFTEDAACLDVVCHPLAQGKWATSRSLKQLYDLVFENYGLKFIWAEPKNSRALKACLQAGFQLVQHAPGDHEIVVLTRDGLKKNFTSMKG